MRSRARSHQMQARACRVLQRKCLREAQDVFACLWRHGGKRLHHSLDNALPLLRQAISMCGCLHVDSLTRLHCAEVLDGLCRRVVEALTHDCPPQLRE